MVKFCEIKRQMLFTDMMERSYHSPLEKGEKSFQKKRPANGWPK
jgi:hypothetical protein